MSNSRSLPRNTAPLRPRKSPTQSRSIYTVDAILIAASDILERFGFDRYTTNEIAARAGVSIGSLYQYFPGKDAITIALIERDAAGLVEEIREAFQTSEVRSALRALVAVAVRHQLRRPQLAKLLDFEQARLAVILPASNNARLIRTEIADFLTAHLELDAAQGEEAAIEVMSVIRALTDVAGHRGCAEPDELCRRIEGALFGYLQTLCSSPELRVCPSAADVEKS